MRRFTPVSLSLISLAGLGAAGLIGGVWAAGAQSPPAVQAPSANGAAPLNLEPVLPTGAGSAVDAPAAAAAAAAAANGSSTGFTPPQGTPAGLSGGNGNGTQAQADTPENAVAALATGTSPQDASDAALKIRDPFKRPGSVSAETPKSELEQFPIEKFKMIGVVTGLRRLKAMITAPNNKTYFVSQGMPIGMRKGVIRKITPDGIFVREKIMNVLGKEENADSEIRMPADGRGVLQSGEGW